MFDRCSGRDRRAFLAGAAGSGLLLAGAARPGLAQAGTERFPTPAQTAGPFYPTEMPREVDNDLVWMDGSVAPARGVVAHVMGRVVTQAGRPVADAVVEIWQCDAHGRYLHPRSGGSRERDPGFQGYGRMATDASGAYRFRTIRPVPYMGRTPHIHFAVRSASGNLVTQMYVAGDPGNEQDFLYRRLDPRQRAALTVELKPAAAVEPAALAGRFDIVLAG